MLLEIKELARALQGGGATPEPFEHFLRTSYGASADLRYQRARYSAGLSRFIGAFPEVRKISIARAPGLLSLMGEYPECHGLPVLKMALERDIVVIFSPRRDRRVNLVNTSFWYSPRSFEISRRIRPFADGSWANHAKMVALALQAASSKQLRGMDACVMGDIPVDSGLSSSTALVTALTAALSSANGLPIDRKSVVSLLGENHDSLRMDSWPAALVGSLFAEPARALKIETAPLSTMAVPVPRDCSFVVCNSLTTADRTGRARDAISQRVTECRLGAAMLAEYYSGPNLDHAFPSKLRAMSSKRQAEVLEAIPDGPVHLRDVAKSLRMPMTRLRESALRLNDDEVAQEPRGGFRVKPRVRHVLSEGKRVELAARALEQGDSRLLGRVMDESHASCSMDYDVSTPDLDALAAICREEGALGARMTGGGFGGCVVALVHDCRLAEFEAAIISRYYHDYLQRERRSSPISVMALEDAVFPCKPCSGATVLGTEW